MSVRIATRQDEGAVRQINLAAFPESERDLVAGLAVDLLAGVDDQSVLALVASRSGGPVGYVAFSRVQVDGDPEISGFILAPLAVMPEFQKTGIGSELINTGIQSLADNAVDFVLVYGDPDYYGRFGFDAEAAAALLAPYPLEYPFGWQCRPLSDRATGRSPAGIRCVAALSRPELW